jgi:hypothetical protein
MDQTRESSDVDESVNDVAVHHRNGYTYVNGCERMGEEAVNNTETAIQSVVIE